MSRETRRKKPEAPAPPPTSGGPLAHNPFQSLKGLKIEKKSPEPAPEPVRPKPRIEAPARDDDLFLAAMADVRPVDRDNPRRAPGPQGDTRRPLYNEDLEALAKLEDLVAGRAQFDIVDSDEYVEGHIRGLHPVILEKLRRGRFSIQAHLDLHGLTVREADEAVREFIQDAVVLGYRCVLLVHGRGLNSKDQIPVLKKRLETILLRGPVKKQILAFTSARPVDGGTGASYVLLRAKR